MAPKVGLALTKRVEGEDDMKDKIREELLAAAKDGKVSCKTGLGLAEKLGCDPSLVGEVANEESIKVVSCSLGCF